MKALVAVKRVLDYNVKPKIKADGSGIDLTNLKMSMNPFDEIAVEEAVRMKEAGHVTEMVVVSIGPPPCQETLRTALALGADRALLVTTEHETDPLTAAKILKILVEREKPHFVILGKQAIDDDCNQTGQMLAGLLGWAQGTFASKITLEKDRAQVTREVDGGLETISCSLPAVFTTDLRLNDPRYPKLPNIMKAKQKPLEILPLEDLGLEPQQHQKILKVAEPPQRKGGVKVSTVTELMTKLTQEARIL